ncbi:MAG: DUF4349 domain-containing protein [Lachnospiraceae bacterium]|nr:DUF4349 domain-containing protein [Lachnospiraceae bacterium]
MKKSILTAIGVILSGAMLLTGCGGGSAKDYAGNFASQSTATADYAPAEAESYYDYGYYDESGTAYEESYNGDFGTTSGKTADAVDDSASVSDSKKVDNNRKLIKTVNLDVETKQFDDLINAVDAQVSAYDGYVESMNTWNGSRYDYYGNYTNSSSRNSSYTIRIPRENLEAFIESFSPLCNIKNRSESVEDITLSYVDLESHKKALETEEERLLELMEQATEMYDILTIEDKLTDIRYQLQSMESQLRTYDNKVTYSTVYLTIAEVKELTIVEPEPVTFWDKLTSNFADSIEAMGDGFQSFVIWFIAALPHLILWGGIIFGLVMLIRAIVRFNIKKARKRKEEAAKNAPAQPAQPVYYAQYPYGYAQPVAPQNVTSQANAQTVANQKSASQANIQSAPTGQSPAQANTQAAPRQAENQASAQPGVKSENEKNGVSKNEVGAKKD